MASLKEAILRNCLIGSMCGENFTITENAGYIVFNWSNGKTSRLHRACNGVDQLLELPDGSTMRIAPSALI